MGSITKHEMSLIDLIEDDAAKRGLGEIRSAMQNIWSADAPRIIKDYTDHGEKHSERVVGYCARLLAINKEMGLTQDEIFVLLSAIYLHDIGMQCDVVKWPEIKRIAEDMGAKFDVEFNSPSSGLWGIEEQKAIREEHQYLSAAWIDYASRTHSTALGPAMKHVGTHLVDDIMHLCLYHSRLPIRDCPLEFKFDINGRKQFLAALLRLSDEMDIESHRVNIETVRNFRLDPRNSVYWWLHNNTTLNFTSSNVVALTVRVNPAESKEVGRIILDTVVHRFYTKNRPVFNILRHNGIAIEMSANSGVVEDDRTHQLPPEIIHALKLIDKQQEDEFDKNIEVLFQTIPIDRNVKARSQRETQDKPEVMEPQEGTGHGESYDETGPLALGRVSHEYYRATKRMLSQLIKRDFHDKEKDYMRFRMLLLFMLTNIKETFDVMTGDSCGVSIELINGESSLITLMRDPVSFRAGEHLRSQYYFHESTASSKIFDPHQKGFYFLSNDLSDEKAYVNPDPSWRNYYNACLSVAIGTEQIAQEQTCRSVMPSIVLGLITVVNFNGMFDKKTAPVLLGIHADLCYQLINMFLNVEDLRSKD